MVGRRDIVSALAVGPNLRRLFLRKAGAGESHLAPLDGLRALALLWVILTHSGWFAWFALPRPRYVALLLAPWMVPFWRGDFAVEVFFVMSAFLIGGLITDERTRTGKVRIGAFYARRLLRLWPALVAAALFDYFFGAAPARYAVWPNVLYVNNLLPIATVGMGWTWSLAIEEQFYLTVPWLLGGLHRLELRVRGAASRVDPVILGLVLLGVVQACVIAWIVVSEDLHPADSEVVVNRPFLAWRHGYDLLYSKPWMRFGPLLSGLGCARLWRRPGFMAWLGQTGARGTIALVLAFLVGFTAMHWPMFQHAPRLVQVLYLSTYRTVFGLVCGYGMLLVLSKHPVGAALGRFLSRPIFFPLAQLAYCAYLVNPVVANTTHHWLGPSLASATPMTAFLTFVGFDVPGTFACAIVLSLVAERPFMELRKVLVPQR